MESYECGYLFRRSDTVVWMEATMYEDELISLDDMWQREEPISVSMIFEEFSDFSGLFILRTDPVFASLTHLVSFW